MFQLICQVVLVLTQVLGYFLFMHDAIVGRDGKPPEGWSGFKRVTFCFIATDVALYGAGAFSLLLP